MNGVIKWFNKKKGYGFIKGEDEKDYFVHYTSVPRGVFLREEDTVTFDPVENEKGLQSQNVQKTGGSSAPRRDNFNRNENRSAPSTKPANTKPSNDQEDDEQDFSDEEDDDFN